jgi:hypothetical protein
MVNQANVVEQGCMVAMDMVSELMVIVDCGEASSPVVIYVNAPLAKRIGSKALVRYLLHTLHHHSHLFILHIQHF